MSDKERKPTGLKDRNGLEIHTGDVVEFYYRAHPQSDRIEDGEYSPVPNPKFTTMRDVVVPVDGEFYFMCDTGGSYAWRHARHCVIVGRVPLDFVDGQTLLQWLRSPPIVEALRRIGERAQGSRAGHDDAYHANIPDPTSTHLH